MNGPSGAKQRMGARTAFLLCLAVLECCSHDLAAIEGKWYTRTEGAMYYEMRLSDARAHLTGVGQYYIVYPRPAGTFRIEGAFADPVVTWTLTYAGGGTPETFVGTLTDRTLEGNVGWVDVHG